MGLQVVDLPTLPIVRTHLIVTAVLVVLTLAVVALRIVARVSTNSSLWWDDWLILLSVPQGLTMFAIQAMYTQLGVGYSIKEALPNLPRVLRLMVAYAIIFSTAIATIKLSVLCFYLRVFVNKGVRLATKLFIGFVIAWTTANILAMFLICRPFKASYEPTVKGKCGNEIALFIDIGAFNIVSDLFILTLPVPTILKLHMRLHIKVGLVAVFLVGLLVSAVAAARIATLTHMELANLTETMVWVDFLSAAEVNLAILCVSLPMLGPIYGRYIKRKGASRLGESSSRQKYNLRSSSVKLSGGKKKARGPDTIALESIYAANMETHYDTTVTGAEDRERDTSSRDSSKTSLNPVPKMAISKDADGKTIVVQKQWAIRHDER